MSTLRRAEALSTSSQTLVVHAYPLDLKGRVICSYFREETVRSISDVSLGLIRCIVTVTGI